MTILFCIISVADDLPSFILRASGWRDGYPRVKTDGLSHERIPRKAPWWMSIPDRLYRALRGMRP